MVRMSIPDTEWVPPPADYPPAPEGRVLYVIGDIHGRRDLLEGVFRAIDRDKARTQARDRAARHPRTQDNSGVEPAASTSSHEERSRAATTRSASFIAPDVTVNGLIEAKGDVRIDGQVCGNINANRIVVGQGANVDGSLVAKDIVIGGNIRGSVWGDNLTLGPTSCVEADVSHNSLVIEPGCYFEGKSRRLDHWYRSSAYSDLQRSSGALEIYLGDYIDRGDDSRGVIDALLERAQHVDAVFLRGNHEQFLLDFLAGKVELSMWKQVGAAATLQSYGVQVGQFSFFASQASLRRDLEAALAGSHARFIADTVPYFSVGPYLFVHAGMRPGIPLEEQQPADLMSIRRQFLDFEGDFGHIVVHGHTPVAQPEFKPNRINLDTEAYSTGRLTCLRIDGNGPELLDA
jgi:serine/threonine protein phosphatase 1